MYFKWVNFMICELYLNKAFIKKIENPEEYLFIWILHNKPT